ncbi:MAG TPA: 16S rRNA (uracil(1498)-N(3))-methyltransferase [Jatrophihabitans sp.]|jgi:16S rRNA (uracil1498-N3)-methyltransferase|uniref:16S rRNA (uracil(1498)-N(3))-methyltransferase n=1 Tax=Jatrophihabitans sp. TaxID=1932789 RepID=UPI002DFAE2A3|nr:16S rRNA (uracil(1498)-N(3))-methyltransferase [Jatrophihabitans sp.]
MTPPLFLVDALDDGAEFTLGGDEGRHAARVKRLGAGEVVWVADGRGALAECVVAAALTDGLRLTVTARRSVAEPDPRLVIVQALPKGERAELAVETMTELGVDAIVPWSASRSITQWHGPRGDKGLDKWRRTAREAAKQSRRARVPVVDPAASTTQVAARLAGAALALVLHEDATTSLAALDLPSGGEIVAVVGPEGGISGDELDSFGAVGAVPVRLGDPVLRTSTAGPAVLAALSLRLGRWG